MEKETMNKYQMARSTQNYLDTNNATWSAIPIINTFKTELDDQLLGVSEQLKATGVSTKGITISKNDLKKQISIKTAVLSGRYRLVPLHLRTQTCLAMVLLPKRM